MIKTVVDRAYYLEADRIALGRRRNPFFTRQWLAGIVFGDDLWRFEIALRSLEYLHNQEQRPWVRIRKLFAYRRYLRLSRMLGYTIPINVFGPGLSIAHVGTIVVNTGARVGANCRLHVCVNIGTEAGFSENAPRIGDNVYIGPGAKIFGGIEIADGCAIGANAVVNKSFMEPGSVIAGVPASKIGEIDTSNILVRATDVLNARGWNARKESVGIAPMDRFT
jgi:serine O-acetyltransferase